MSGYIQHNKINTTNNNPLNLEPLVPRRSFSQLIEQYKISYLCGTGCYIFWYVITHLYCFIKTVELCWWYIQHTNSLKPASKPLNKFSITPRVPRQRFWPRLFPRAVISWELFTTEPAAASKELGTGSSITSDVMVLISLGSWWNNKTLQKKTNTKL